MSDPDQSGNATPREPLYRGPTVGWTLDYEVPEGFIISPNYSTGTEAAADVIATTGGGTIFVPNGVTVTPPASFPGVIFEYLGPQEIINFFTESDNSRVQHLFRSQPLAGFHIGENWGAVGIEHRPSGSGGAGDSGDNALMISVRKQNWGNNALAGQIAGIYLRATNDGPAGGISNDIGAYLFDVIGVHTSGYYSALEGNVYVYETDRITLRKQMFVQVLPTDSFSSDTAIGMLTGPVIGIMNIGQYVRSIPGTSILHAYFYEVNSVTKFDVVTDGSVYTAGSLRTDQLSSVAPQIDASSQNFVAVVAASSHAPITPVSTGYFLIYIAEAQNSGNVAIFMCGLGQAVLVSGNGNWVASTNAPAAGKFSVFHDGTRYAVYNGAGGTNSFKTIALSI